MSESPSIAHKAGLPHHPAHGDTSSGKFGTGDLGKVYGSCTVQACFCGTESLRVGTDVTDEMTSGDAGEVGWSAIGGECVGEGEEDNRSGLSGTGVGEGTGETTASPAPEVGREDRGVRSALEAVGRERVDV